MSMLQSATLKNANISNNASTQKKGMKSKDMGEVFDQMMLKHQGRIDNSEQTSDQKESTQIKNDTKETKIEVEQSDKTEATQTRESAENLLHLYTFFNQNETIQVSMTRDNNSDSFVEESLNIGLDVSVSEEQAVTDVTNMVDSQMAIDPVSPSIVMKEEDSNTNQIERVFGQQKENFEESILTQDTDIKEEGLANSKDMIHNIEEQTNESETVRKEETPYQEDNVNFNRSQLAPLHTRNVEQNQVLTGVENQEGIVTISVPQVEKLPEQLINQLESLRLQEKNEFEIQLEPANLGKIAMKISYDQGKASISLVCSNSMTATLLTSQAEQMGQLMEKHLGAPTEILVDQQENRSWQEDNQNQRQSQNSQQQKEEQERRYYEALQHRNREDFLQQLRIGLI